MGLISRVSEKKFGIETSNSEMRLDKQWVYVTLMFPIPTVQSKEHNNKGILNTRTPIFQCYFCWTILICITPTKLLFFDLIINLTKTRVKQQQSMFYYIQTQNIDLSLPEMI